MNKTSLPLILLALCAAPALAEDYQHDQATGYTPGQIRDAVSIKRSL